MTVEHLRSGAILDRKKELNTAQKYGCANYSKTFPNPTLKTKSHHINRKPTHLHDLQSADVKEAHRPVHAAHNQIVQLRDELDLRDPIRVRGVLRVVLLELLSK